MSRKCPIDFCKWVNKNLLPNCTLELGYPWKISQHVYQLGFEIITPHKGIFIDSHKRHDVTAYRKIFLRKMVKIGFLHFSNGINTKGNSYGCGPSNIRVSVQNGCFFFHDESIFSTNEDQNKK